MVFAGVEPSSVSLEEAGLCKHCDKCLTIKNLISFANVLRSNSSWRTPLQKRPGWCR